MKKRIVTLLAVLAILSTVQDGSAFDGARRGFILGGGVGIGVDSFQQELSDNFDSIQGDRENKLALATDFKIGGGLSDQVLLYYHNHMAWISLENVFGNSVTIASGVTGVGVTWFTSPELLGFFLTGTLGLSYWDAPFESGSKAATGVGAIVGTGYEFSPHWSVDASLILGSPELTESGITLQTSSASLLITVTGLAY